MKEDVIILASDGTVLKKTSRSKADWMLRLGIAAIYQPDGPMKIMIKSAGSAETVIEAAQKTRSKAPKAIDRPAGRLTDVVLLNAHGEFQKKVSQQSAALLIQSGLASVYSQEPYTLILKAPPQVDNMEGQVHQPKSPLSAGAVKQHQFRKYKKLLKPYDWFVPKSTKQPHKETV